MPTRTGLVWLGVGVLSAVTVYLLAALGLWHDVLAIGGADWRSLARATLEAFVCAGLAVGLVVLCRQVFRRPVRLLSAMSTGSYAAYILHIWVVVALQAAMLAVPLEPRAKFAVVAVLGVAVTFGLAQASRRVPGVRVALGSAVSSRH